MKKILLLASNPRGTSVLDLDREIRDIREGLQRSQNRDQFTIDFRGAVRPIDLRRALLEVKPQVVHFCGHGSGDDGLVLEDDDGKEFFVTAEALADLFAIFSETVECIVLNACYSELQADALVEHINHVIGMSHEIPDDAAISFSIGFYDGIGAGLPIPYAYKLGCSAIQMDKSAQPESSRKLIPIYSPDDRPQRPLPPHLIPVLKSKQDLGLIPTPPSISTPNDHQRYQQFIGHADWIRSIAFSPDGKTILSGSNDKTVRLWDLETRQLLRLMTGHRDRIKAVGISPDGQYLLSSSADGFIKAWEAQELTLQKTGNCRYTIKASSQPLTLVNTLPISHIQPIFATGAAHGKVSLWDLVTGQWIRTLQAHTSPVMALTFSLDGQRIVSGSAHSTIKIWDLNSTTTDPLHVINHAHLSEVLSLAISPDQQILVSAGADRTIKRWDLNNCSKLDPHILEGHAGRVWCVAISPDGTLLASASADFTVKLWNLVTGDLLQTFAGHLGEVRTVAFSPDGKLLASGGDDLEIKLWNLADRI